MTRTEVHTAAQPEPAHRLRPDVRLITLHQERGDAHGRLENALAALEGADWGLTLGGEAALAGQLRALLGAGVLRLDPRLPVRRDLLAEAGLAAAGLEGDWRGAVAAWLLEPTPEDLQRAERAGVPVIADATLAPGAHWLAAGARYVTYHHSAALTGFAGTDLALLFGAGERPVPAAPAAADLAVSFALRDVATLPLRLARAAQTAAALAGELAGQALPLGPTALLLPHEAAPVSEAPLGGVAPATKPVQGGMVLTPGLADTRQVLALLRRRNGDAVAPHVQAPASSDQLDADPRKASTQSGVDTGERRDRTNHEYRGQRRADRRPEGRLAPLTHQSEAPQNLGPDAGEAAGVSGAGTGAAESAPGLDRSADGSGSILGPAPSQPQAQAAASSQPLERFVFEAPARGLSSQPQASAPAAGTPAADTLGIGETRPVSAPASSELWEDQTEPASGDTTPSDPSEFAGADGQEAEHYSAHGRSSRDRSGQDRSERRGEQSGRRERGQRGRDGRGDRGPQPPLRGSGLEASGDAADGASHVMLPPDLPETQPGGGRPDPTADLTEEQSAVFARLRDWRNAEASRQEISRFIVASNATLAEIARRVPYTVQDLESIKGMGPARLSKYGEAIVQVVRGVR